jgi:hypothetical protein
MLAPNATSNALKPMACEILGKPPSHRNVKIMEFTTLRAPELVFMLAQTESRSCQMLGLALLLLLLLLLNTGQIAREKRKRMSALN